MFANHTFWGALRQAMRVNGTIRLLALMLFTFCSLVMARDLDQDEALNLRQKGVILPLQQLIQTALNRYPGSKMLEAELEDKHGIYIYEIELLTPSGIVRELEFNASNGQLLKDKVDD